MSDDTTYNGWKNYETWCVKLWIDNEQSEHDAWRRYTRDAWRDAAADRAYEGQSRLDAARIALAGSLKDLFEEAIPDLGATLWADLLNAALSEVDWFEIAGNMLEDEELTDDDEEDEEGEDADA